MKSLKLKIALMLISFLVLLVVTPFFINHLFLENYYIYTKEVALQESFAYVKQHYTGDIEQITEDILAIQDKNNMLIVLMSDKCGLLYPNYSKLLNTSTLVDNVEMSTVSVLSDNIIDTQLISQISRERISSKLPEHSFDVKDIRLPDAKDNFLILEETWIYEDEELFITLQTPISAVTETITVVSQFFSMTVVTIGILGIGIVVLIANKLTIPIVAINKVATNISNLQFDQKLEISSKDEVGQLAHTINQLSAQLQRHIINLEDNIKRKEHSEEIRKQFISNVSHELKTPLALILGYTAGLKMGLDKDSQDFYCEVIEDESIKMSKLVNKLLEISQMEYGGMNLNKEEFDIKQLIENVVKKNQLKFKEKNIDYHSQLEEIIINADYDYIEQVVTNYLTNALTHVNFGGYIMVISKKSAGYMKLEIINTGSKIPDSDIENVWESFYKVNKARTREYGGHGLGLYIVKMIVEMHEGEYYVRNLAEGVCFGIKLKIS